MGLEVEHCPACGAPLVSGERLCSYCKAELRVGAETAVGPPEGPLLTVRGGVAVSGILAAAAGGLLVEAARCFWVPHGEPIGISVAIGACAILLLYTRRHGAAFAISIVTGLAFFTKPLVRPAYPASDRISSLSSETGLTYVLPGLLFLTLAIAVGLFLWAEGRILARARPRLIPTLAFAAGISLTAALSPPTKGEIYERYRAEFSHHRERLGHVARRIETATPPSHNYDLAPSPVLVVGSPEESNTSILAFEQLDAPERRPDLDLYLGGMFLAGLQAAAPEADAPEWFSHRANARERSGIRRAAAIRWLGVYLARPDGVALWLVDLPLEKVVLYQHYPGRLHRGDRRKILAGLAAATGGTFRDR